MLSIIRFQFRRLPILAILAIFLSRPHPHGPDQDSKGVIRFDPGNSALNQGLNRVELASNRVKSAVLLLFYHVYWV